MDILGRANLGVLRVSDPNSSSCLPILSYDTTIVLSIVCSLLGIIWMAYNIIMLRRIDLSVDNEMEGEEGLIEDMPLEQRKLLLQFAYKTYDAALSFLKLEYVLCIATAAAVFLLLFFLTSLAASTAISFLVGSIISMLSGIASLILTTRASPRVAYCSKFGIGPTYRTAYQTCSAIGFGVASFNLLGLTIAIEIFKQQFDLNATSVSDNYFRGLFEAVAGYGLGCSLVALITRMGGAMFQAGTQSGSELIGKTEGALPFTHSRNAGTIALHAGYNMQGIVGAGCDLLGSYSQITCVAFILGSTSIVGWQGDTQTCATNLAVICLPLTILSLGLVGSLVVSVFGVAVVWVQSQTELIKAIRKQRLLSAASMVFFIFLGCFLSLPSQFKLQGVFNSLNSVHAYWQVYLCALVGNIALVALSLFGQFTTSQTSTFVQSLANRCRKGSAAALTLGFAFGYLSSFAPATIVALTAFYGYQFLGFYGIGVALLGIVASFPVQLAIQTLKPLSLNASTSSKVANLNEDQREITSILGGAGQTTATISRTIGMGCSALIGLTLFGGFLRNANLDSSKTQSSISLSNPEIFAGLMIGAVFPFLIAGITVRGARKSAQLLVTTVNNQLRQDQAIAREESEVDYGETVRPIGLHIFKSLIPPVLIVVLLPFILGIALSPSIIAGLLPGIVVSGLQFSSSASASGQAWTSSKQLIERVGVADQQGSVQGRDSAAHRAASIGAWVGNFLKDNAGCAINSSTKLMGMLAVLFGSKFAQLHE